MSGRRGLRAGLVPCPTFPGRQPPALSHARTVADPCGSAGSSLASTGETNGSLLAVPFDLDRLEVTGPAVPVLDDVWMYSLGTGVAQFSISRSGALVYIAESASVPERSLVWVDRQGRVEPVTEERREFWEPRLSPDGGQLAVSVEEGLNEDVWIYDLRRDTKTRLTFGKNNWGAVWTRDGRHVVFGSNREGAFNLFRKAVDGSGVTDHVKVQVSDQLSTQPTAIRGTAGRERGRFSHPMLGRDGSAMPHLTAESQPWSVTRCGIPSGHHNGLRLRRASGADDDALVDEVVGKLHFSPVGNSSGSAERLTRSIQWQYPTSVSPDGRFLAYGQQEADTGWDIWGLPLAGDREPQLVIGTPFWESGAAFSPDGGWLAYGSRESGRLEVYVRPFPGPGRRWPISTDGGREPLWSTDGRELFYREGRKVMAVPVRTQPTFQPGSPRLLFEGRYYRNIYGPPTYDITPDGQRFVMVQEPEESATEHRQIIYIHDFFDELKAKMAEAGQ